MSFSFGFSGNDFNDEEIIDTTQLNTTNVELVNPLDDQRLISAEVIHPSIEDLNEILQSLANVRLTFEEFHTPVTHTTLHRRELFDIKHQLMSEDSNDDISGENTELEILIGDTSEDVRKNVYEGGLKSWECSIDLVDALVDIRDKFKTLSNYDTILELGCGTALPTEYIFNYYLESNENRGLNLVLSDYNRSVLRLVTIPNLIITWAKTSLNQSQCNDLQTKSDPATPVRDDELLLTTELLQAFLTDLNSRNITLNIISGSWSRSFNNLVKSIIPMSTKNLLILTSETIYQPENLPIVAETIIDLKTYYNHNSVAVTSLLAAKDIYFGVGGSIVEFENYLSQQIQQFNLELSYKTFKINAGLKRSIMHIE